MIVETSLVALLEGQKVELKPGDTLRVTVTFDAAMTTDVTTELWVSLVYGVGRDYTIKTSVALSHSATPLPYTVVVDMPINVATGLENRTYDLWAELPSYPWTDAQVKIPGVIVITGMPAGFLSDIGNMISLLIVMMMMEMMMGMMGDMNAPAGIAPRPQPKPVTEAVVKGAKKAAEYGGRAVKRITEYYRERGEEED